MKRITLLIVSILPWCLCAQSLFTKVTDAGPIVTFTNTGAQYKGAAWIDLDDDNWPDLFASQYFMFRNNRDGSFTQLPNLNGGVTGQGAAGSSWGDIDNDGHPDCITASAMSGLHLNDGNNAFTLQTALLPNFTAYSAWDCALADADNNGRLDLTFVHACCNFLSGGPFPCRLYLQGNDGTFTEKTGYEFTSQLKPYTIPVWSDYDLDGDVDLFIGSGPAGTAGPDFCYKNLLKESGTFDLQRLTTPPFDQLQDGQTYNFPDYDNDGDLDICLTNYNGAPNRFWRNNGNGMYTSLTTPFTSTGSYLANAWGDLDNDGDLDVLISLDQNSAVRFHRNRGDGTFDNLQTAGTAGASVCGIALADYDNDGDLDFFTHGTLNARALFRNDTLAGNRHWIQFTLQGMASNRSAIGAVLRVKAVINGVPTWQIREIQAHNSFQSQHDLRQHVGLGDATVVDSIEVRWPSGAVEHFAGQTADNFYKIVEGEGLSVITAVKSPDPSLAFDVSPNPAGRELRLKCPEKIVSVNVFDTIGTAIPVNVELAGNTGVIRFDGPPRVGPCFIRVYFGNGRQATQMVIRQ